MFSVLLSLYHKESPTFLSLSLDSVLHQTLLPDEVVLVKDGPLTAELDAIVSDYATRHPILKVVPLPQNQGLGKALNEGLKHCSYDLVARMDTDDIAKPDRFEKQMKVFAEHPELDLVGAWIDEFEGTPQHVLSVRKVPETSKEIREYCQKRCPVNHPVVMFRKSAVQAAGGYQHFPLFEDYYLWVRMLKNGAKFYNIQESLLYFRTSPDMFKRRGGWKYAMDELRFQSVMRKIEMIGWKRFLMNVAVRFPGRVIPNSLRGFLYKKLMRK